VTILYQLIRVYIDTNQWPKAEESLNRLATLASTSQQKEFIIRAHWLQSWLDSHHQRYEVALEALNQAANLAEQIDSRMAQYIVQIQKSYVYHLSGNAPASRDALAYAQKLQKRLVDTLSDEASRQAFWHNAHARRLQEVVQAHAENQAKAKVVAGDAAP
jgi:hypothetical protein